METKLLNQKGEEVGSIELNDSVFSVNIDKGLIHKLLIYQLSNSRQVSAHTKTRGEVSGSTRKIYRQKGTGKARAGAVRSPIRIGGGVVFGPRNNVNFLKMMNKKERRLALCSILSSKVKSNEIFVLDKITFDAPKTKNMISVLNSLSLDKKTLIALPERNEIIEKSASNLPKVKTLHVSYLNPADLLKYNNLVLLKESAEKLNTIR